MKKFTIAILCSILYSSALLASELNYNYFEVGYQSTRFDFFDKGLPLEVDNTGLFAEFSMDLGETIYGFINYKSGSGNLNDFTEEFLVGANLRENVDMEHSELRLGVGYKYPLSDAMDFVTTAGLINKSSESELNLVLDYVDPFIVDEVLAVVFTNDDDGYFSSVGLRTQLGETLELNGQILYTDYEDFGQDTFYEAAVVYNLTPVHGLSFKAGYLGSHVNLLALEYRFNFGLSD